MNTESKTSNPITDGVIWKQLLIFFFPIMVGTLFQQLYNTVDAVIVGRFVGKQALASVGGSAAVLSNFVIGFFTGLSSGATVIIAQYYGAKDEKNLNKGLHTAYAFSIIASILISIIGWFANAGTTSSSEDTGRYDPGFYPVSADLLPRHHIYPDLQHGICDHACPGRLQTSALLSDRMLFFEYCTGPLYGRSP